MENTSLLAGMRLPVIEAEEPVVVFWFRRDLRLHDNAGLWQALCSGRAVVPLFIFDADILSALRDSTDKRVGFIHSALSALRHTLAEQGRSFAAVYGRPADVFRHLLEHWNIEAVYANEDYEPYARQRDREVAMLLREHGAELRLYKDQVIHAKDEVMSDQGTHFQVFTAYKRKWLERTPDISTFASQQMVGAIAPGSTVLPSLQELGFTADSSAVLPPNTSIETLRSYAANRDIPWLDATTHSSVHLRFGTVSVRNAVQLGRQHSDVWLSELVWREFFMMILYHRPDVVHSCYRREYNGIRWRNNTEEFERWCQGCTGYPMVDAGMRELNTTGFMHNRVRMTVASFLVKDLLIDWRWGEAYFAKKLLDYDLAANNGNWQWSAGTGCDAAPYFRIFNPESQRQKFDPDDKYCRKWIPELGTASYPQPIVDHAVARQRTLQAYSDAVQEFKSQAAALEKPRKPPHQSAQEA